MKNQLSPYWISSGSFSSESFRQSAVPTSSTAPLSPRIVNFFNEGYLQSSVSLMRIISLGFFCHSYSKVETTGTAQYHHPLGESSDSSAICSAFTAPLQHLQLSHHCLSVYLICRLWAACKIHQLRAKICSLTQLISCGSRRDEIGRKDRWKSLGLIILRSF